MKFENSYPHCSKVNSKVKVFFFNFKLQGQGHGVKSVGIGGNVMSIGLLKGNINALTLSDKKLLAKFMLQRELQTHGMTE